MNRRHGLQPAILRCLAAAPATVAEIYRYVTGTGVRCCEDAVRKNPRQLDAAGLVKPGPQRLNRLWELTGDGAETTEIGRFVP